jgi:serine/threonine protein phosphatase PrpC
MMLSSTPDRKKNMLGKRTSSERILSDRTSSFARMTSTMSQKEVTRNAASARVAPLNFPMGFRRKHTSLHKSKSARTMINTKSKSNKHGTSSLNGFLDELVDTQVDEDYGIACSLTSSSYDSDSDSDSSNCAETISLTGSVDLQIALSPLSVDGAARTSEAMPPRAPLPALHQDRPAVGMSKSQGPRVTMEDRIVAVPCGTSGVLCAVYDGHGGDATSERLCHELHERVLAHSEFEKGHIANALVGAFQEQEQVLDTGARHRLRQSGRPSLTRTRAFRTSGRASILANDLIRTGSTATVVVINSTKKEQNHTGAGSHHNMDNNPTGKQLHVCWLGDSRAVLSRAGKAVELTRDHRASDPQEKERVIQAGGQVDCAGRMFGDLALSRAFGNFFHKWKTTSIADGVNAENNNNNNNGAEISCGGGGDGGGDGAAMSSCPHVEQSFAALSAVPEIETVDLTSADEFVCVASDGIWDSVTNQQVVDLVHAQLAIQEGSEDGIDTIEVLDPCARAARAIIELALENGCKDNASVVVVKLV